MRDAVLFFFTQAAGYTLVTINFRAVADNWLGIALATDALNLSLGFFVFRRMIRNKEATDLLPFVGYLLGGLVGTVIGMRII